MQPPHPAALYPHPRVTRQNGDGEYTDYDPRLRPWYVSASAGSKNVIILIDASSTMKLSGRFEIAQKLAKFALDSLTSNDYVNVIMFNDAAESSDCFPERLVRATGPTVDRLKTYIDDYNPSGSSRSGPGFETAFAYINDGVLEGTASSCNSVILMISDNLATDPTDVIARENPTNDVAVFTYTIGNDADQEVAKALTCDNRGIWQVCWRLLVALPELLWFDVHLGVAFFFFFFLCVVCVVSVLSTRTRRPHKAFSAPFNSNLCVCRAAH